VSVGAPDLLELDRLSVAFKPGQTALGHRWILRDGDDAEIGRTALFYEGSGKTMGRLMRVTGLSTSGTIHARVLDERGEERFRIHSFPGKDRHVDIEDAQGAALGRARRNDLSLGLFAPGGDGALATIVRADKADLAFPIETPTGERLAVLTKQRLEVSAPTISTMVLAPDIASNQLAFQATMHLGFAGSREYHLLVERRPSEQPLATLLALTPLIAAYAY
jgi:hypothetical protein